MTCSLFFSLFLAVSMRQVDIASKAAFTALRASSESAGAHIGLKLRGVTSAYLFCMAASPVNDCRKPLGEPRNQRHPSVLLRYHSGHSIAWRCNANSKRVGIAVCRKSRDLGLVAGPQASASAAA